MFSVCLLHHLSLQFEILSQIYFITKERVLSGSLPFVLYNPTGEGKIDDIIKKRMIFFFPDWIESGTAKSQIDGGMTMRMMMMITAA